MQESPTACRSGPTRPLSSGGIAFDRSTASGGRSPAAIYTGSKLYEMRSSNFAIYVCIQRVNRKSSEDQSMIDAFRIRYPSIEGMRFLRAALCSEAGRVNRMLKFRADRRENGSERGPARVPGGVLALDRIGELGIAGGAVDHVTSARLRYRTRLLSRDTISCALRGHLLLRTSPLVSWPLVQTGVRGRSPRASPGRQPLPPVAAAARSRSRSR